MATIHEQSWYNLTKHRRWEDLASLAIGLVVLLAPMIIQETHEARVYFSAGFAGCMIAALALLEMVSLRRWEELLEMAFGLWLAISPYVLGYGGATATLHVVAGIAVILLAILEYWQDRDRKIES